MSESLFTADEVRDLVNAAVDRMRFACEEGVLGGVVEPKLREAATRIKGYFKPLGTDDGKVYEELSIVGRRQLSPLDTVPRDGTPFVVHTKHTFRWVAYRDGRDTLGKHGQKLSDGTLGRWQTLDDKGIQWVNTPEPKGVWEP